MKVSSLIGLLKNAPADADVVIAQYNGRFDDGDVTEIEGAIVLDGGKLKLCEYEECPNGIKQKFCPACGLGSRSVWLVLKPDGPAWVEYEELRGPHDTQNRYEFADPMGVVSLKIAKDAPLPPLPEKFSSGG